jgi:hypothetical protein
MLLVIKNDGPGKMQVDAGYEYHWVEIMPGKVWATEAHLYGHREK